MNKLIVIAAHIACGFENKQDASAHAVNINIPAGKQAVKGAAFQIRLNQTVIDLLRRIQQFQNQLVRHQLPNRASRQIGP